METYKVLYFNTFNRKTILQEKKLTKKCFFRLVSGFEQVVWKYSNFKFQNLNYLSIFEDVLQTFSFLQHKRITKQLNRDWKSSTIWNKKVRPNYISWQEDACSLTGLWLNKKFVYWCNLKNNITFDGVHYNRFTENAFIYFTQNRNCFSYDDNTKSNYQSISTKWK